MLGFFFLSFFFFNQVLPKSPAIANQVFFSFHISIVTLTLTICPGPWRLRPCKVSVQLVYIWPTVQHKKTTSIYSLAMTWIEF